MQSKSMPTAEVIKEEIEAGEKCLGATTKWEGHVKSHKSGLK